MNVTHVSLHHADFSKPPSARLLIVGSGEDLARGKHRSTDRHGLRLVVVAAAAAVVVGWVWHQVRNTRLSPPRLRPLQSPSSHRRVEATGHHWRAPGALAANWEESDGLTPRSDWSPSFISDTDISFFLTRAVGLVLEKLTCSQRQRWESHCGCLWQSPAGETHPHTHTL